MKLLGVVALGILATALTSGCATPNQAKLNEFPTLTLQDTAKQETDQLCVEVARVGTACLGEMFRTPKVNRQFTVCWLSVRSKRDVPVLFDRNRIALKSDATKSYPVGPGRVAYLSKSNPTALLIATVVFPVLMPIGAPIAASGGVSYYAAVNVTGVAASAHVAGAQASNDRRSQGTRLGSLPDTATIQPGETLAGFIFFEVPGEDKSASVIEGELVSGSESMVFSLRDIPEVNPKFGKENNNGNRS